MLSTPRGALFWLILIILLFLIAIAPIQAAHVFLEVIHAISKFFAGLKAFIETLSAS
ncbi:hypothetical protein ABZ383_21235 [Streptomyces sp. NPDC005900]|uniref:hypothetical protein n=1 Tax=Streptomyces sp. NPDC005900 TaxID=3154569 RepID=UPI0033EB85F1